MVRKFGGKRVREEKPCHASRVDPIYYPFIFRLNFGDNRRSYLHAWIVALQNGTFGNDLVYCTCNKANTNIV